MRVLKRLIVRWWRRFCGFVRNNLNNFANLLILLVPFASLLAGMYSGFQFTGAVFVPVVGVALIAVCKAFSSILGRGYDIPVPLHRFTTIEPSGEVWTPQTRIQELLLYVADLEDWLDRNGYFDETENNSKSEK